MRAVVAAVVAGPSMTYGHSPLLGFLILLPALAFLIYAIARFIRRSRRHNDE